MTEILKIAAVTKKYKKHVVLNNITFGINEGEIVGLVGPNGAGKTTLMRIIVGLTKKFDGKVVYNINNTNKKNKEVLKDKRDKKIFGDSKKIFGCMIETPKFYPYMSGYDNLKFFATLNGKLDKKSFNEIISLTGLSSAIKKKTKAYSLGMRQRLGLAQALIGNPKILVLDEPTNGLDPNGLNEVRKYLKNIATEKKIAILISSHTLSEIEKICSRIVILKNGNLIEIIDPNNTDNKEFNESIFAFETDELDRFLELLKQKNIIIQDIDKKNNIIKIKLQKEKLSPFIKDIVLKDINFTSVYEVKTSLEEKFLDLTGGNKIV